MTTAGRIDDATRRSALAFLPWVYDQLLWTMLSVTLMALTIYALAADDGRRDPWI